MTQCPEILRRFQEHRWIQRPDGTAGGRHGWTVWPTVYSLLNGVVPVPGALRVHLQREVKSAGSRDDAVGGVLRVIQELRWIGRYAFETCDDWTAASVIYYNVRFNASQWGRGRRCSGDQELAVFVKTASPKARRHWRSTCLCDTTNGSPGPEQ